jgi:hypothetical protein
MLNNPIDHDDRKSLARWLDSQKSYARIEADHLEHSVASDLRFVDRLRLMIWAAPMLMFVYTFFARGGFLDGRWGLYYSMQRTYAELLLALELLDRRLARLLRP